MTERERAEALVGQTIDGRYRIDAVIATGGMGAVYLARHLKLRKRVALKVLHPEVADHDELAQRFEREAHAGAQMSNPHVANATDFGDIEGGGRYLVMDYVRGRTLRAAIDEGAPLGTERAARIARQIAVALDHVHDRGIVHRDIKPRNVMLAEGDYVKLVDFGLAKVDEGRLSTFSAADVLEGDDEGARLTQAGTIFGTIDYLAPEAAFGMEFIDARADLYALGVILYEMLSGKHPFDAKTDAELFAKQRTEAPPPFAERAPGVVVEPELEAVVQKLLAKETGDRFQTASALIDALDEAAPEGSEEPPEPVEVLPPSSVERAGAGASDPPPRPDAKASPPVAPPRDATAADPGPPLSWVVGGSVAAVAIALWFSYGRAPAVPVAAPSAVAAASEAPTAPSPEPTASVEPPAASAATPEPPAPTASAAVEPAPAGPDPEKRAAAQAALDAAVEGKKWSEAGTHLAALLAADRAAMVDPATAKVASKVLVALAKGPDADATSAWRAAALAERGPDLLLRYVATQGKAAHAVKARELLRDPEVAAVASPAVRIAFELRDAPCAAKGALIERAVTEGDERAEVALDLVVRACADAKEVDAGLRALRKRLAAEKKAAPATP